MWVSSESWERAMQRIQTLELAMQHQKEVNDTVLALYKYLGVRYVIGCINFVGSRVEAVKGKVGIPKKVK